jgi:hypothetical protein
MRGGEEGLRGEEEVRKKLEELRGKVSCPRCGAEGKLSWEGELECPRGCLSCIEGDWVTLSAYRALKWVLGMEEELKA